jgi:hypothetical protein
MSSCALVLANCRSLTEEELAEGEGDAVLRRTSQITVSMADANHAELPAETVANVLRTQGTQRR